MSIHPGSRDLPSMYLEGRVANPQDKISVKLPPFATLFHLERAYTNSEQSMKSCF